MSDVLIRGGRVVDPSREFDAVADVLIRGGRIEAVAPDLPAAGCDVLDAGGLVVAPGLIDMHVHLRDPGQTHKEDLGTGSRAAAQGGYTAVACMANTVPPVDHPVVVEYLRSRAREVAACRVYPVAAITKGLQGRELSPIAALAAAGAVALSDDGAAVPDAGLLRRAMGYARMVGLPIIEHCEDASLSGSGVVHDGGQAARLGLVGIPSESEAVIVARDLLLAEATGARLHIAHVSAAASVRLIREAKQRGVPVSAEVTPHHLTLTDADVGEFDTNRKMNPPLRTAADLAALRQALADGTIDVIATDHAPHAVEEKRVEFDRAPFGVIGLETALGVVLTHLVGPGILTLPEAVRRMSTRPAQLLGLPGGSLRPGDPADLVIIDPHLAWTVRAEAFASRSRNTPFEGWTLRGRAVLTMVGGRVTHDL
ncbi:MAG: dihydroorotase, partial [Armatimonadota bacterium]|nr:dihydroorotase [Armatimonadota bacterium]